MSAKSYCQPLVCELSSPDLRGLTTSFYMVAFCLGTTTITFLGSVIVDWRIVVSIIAIVAGLCFLGATVIHESPDRLLQRGCQTSAKQAWVYYNPDKEESEFDQLVEARSQLMVDG